MMLVVLVIAMKMLLMTIELMIMIHGQDHVDDNDDGSGGHSVEDEDVVKETVN